jgi:hypothetical protein
MVRNAHSSFGFTADFTNVPPYRYSADLNYWEYAGSLRYDLMSTVLRPYVKGGYGWSWYRLENIQANGTPFERPETDWTKPGGIWPNTWHYGAGLELVPWKHSGPMRRGTELSFRIEYARYTESLGLDLSSVPLDKLRIAFKTLGDVPAHERVSRNDLTVGVTLSY